MTNDVSALKIGLQKARIFNIFLFILDLCTLNREFEKRHQNIYVCGFEVIEKNHHNSAASFLSVSAESCCHFSDKREEFLFHITVYLWIATFYAIFSL